MCTATMSRIGDIAYKNPNLCYKYKGKVNVPPLGMIDDLLCIQKCSSSVTVNASVNTFIDTIKLRFSQHKCGQIHIGKYDAACPELKVHSVSMNKTNKEKYLGDFISASGSNKDNITERVNKGYAIVSEINNILTDIPLGRFRIDIGLKLRQAMFINATIFNSEAWHNIKNTDIQRLEKVDECLLRKILNCHSKTPLEMLFLETGTLPLRFVIASRRILYYQTIIKRNDSELTKQVLLAQKINPSNGDFIKLVENDCINIGIDIDTIERQSKQVLKRIVKRKVKEAAFKHLLQVKSKHSKVQNIKYTELTEQHYLKSILFSNEDANLLFSLRTKTSKYFKSNFPNMEKSCLHCPLRCWGVDEVPILDTQEHILLCKRLSNLKSSEVTTEKVEYSFLFGEIKKQKEIVTLIKLLLEEKQILCPPGDKLDPSTVQGLCCSSN